MKKHTITRICLIALSSVSYHAYATDNTSDLDYYQELPVVLSASRLSQPLSEAPNAMTVIDRKMIQASGFRTIPDLFKLVPGMYVSYYKGSQAFVSYHGSTDQYARRMQVMIDGRSVYLPPVSTVDWSNLPITVDDIERIEIIRGPAAASHGANSTQGVISIMTKDAGAVNGKRLSITHGNKGINDVSMRYGQLGDTLDYRMTLAYSADHGYDDLTTPPNDISINRSQARGLLNNTNDSNQARLFNFRADYHPNGVDRFDIQFGFNHDEQGVGFNDKNPTASNPNSTNGNPFHDRISNSDFVQLEWLRKLGNASELSVRYSHIRQDAHEDFPVYLGGVFFDNPLTSQTLKISRDEIEIQHTLHTSASNRLVYGAAYEVARVKGWGNIPALPLAYASSSRTDEYRLFAHDEWRITPQWLLNTGAMYEKNSMGQNDISPRVALNFHITPQHTLRIGHSVAYRTPALIEQKYPPIQPGDLFIPNAEVNSLGLRPEKLVSREIGYLGEFPQWKTSLDMRLFRDHVSHGIYASSTDQLENGVTAIYHGFETTLKHSFTENSELTVNFAHESAGSNAAFLVASRGAKLKSNSPDTDDVLTGSIPKNSASLLYLQRFPNDYTFSTAYYYQSAMQPFDRGSIDYQPIQRRMDVRVAKAFKPSAKLKAELAVVVQNLFNQDYTEYVATNLFNRRGYVTLNLNW